MSSKFIDDDDIALALNNGDSSELESLTSEDDGWTDCEDDEEEEIIEERSINNNAVELVSDDEEVQPQHNPSREVANNNNNSLPTWQNNHLYPPNSKKLKNPSIVWKFGGFLKVDGKLQTANGPSNMWYLWKDISVNEI